MPKDCSLITPNSVTFYVPNDAPEKIDSKFTTCNLDGTIDLFFLVDMPANTNTCLATITLINDRILYEETTFVYLSESNCVCRPSNKCIKDLGLKTTNKRQFIVTFNNLISGDKYIATACVDYIG